MEQIVKPKTALAFVKAISGVFITKESPNGITNKEINLMAALLELYSSREVRTITTEDRVLLSNQLNQTVQVTTNYLNTLKKKGLLNEEFAPHPIFYLTKITIDYGQNNVQRASA